MFHKHALHNQYIFLQQTSFYQHDNKEIDVKFDYKIAKDIVGTWELNLDSENSGKNNNSQKSNNTFFITIGFGMNSIFQTNINGVTTNIFAPIKLPLIAICD